MKRFVYRYTNRASSLAIDSHISWPLTPPLFQEWLLAITLEWTNLQCYSCWTTYSVIHVMVYQECQTAVGKNSIQAFDVFELWYFHQKHYDENIPSCSSPTSQWLGTNLTINFYHRNLRGDLTSELSLWTNVIRIGIRKIRWKGLFS